MSGTTVTLNGRTIDLAQALPLTVGDWKSLKNGSRITPKLLGQQDTEMDPEVLAAFTFFVLRKADPRTTESEIDGLTFSKLGAIVKTIGELSKEEPDGPFSTSSTSSAGSTAGASETSKG